MRDDKNNPIQVEIKTLKAKAAALRAEIRLKETSLDPADIASEDAPSLWDDDSREMTILRLAVSMKAIENYSFEAGAITAYKNVLRVLREDSVRDMRQFIKKYFQQLQKSFKCVEYPFTAGAICACKLIASELGLSPSELSEPV